MAPCSAASRRAAWWRTTAPAAVGAVLLLTALGLAAAAQSATVGAFLLLGFAAGLGAIVYASCAAAAAAWTDALTRYKTAQGLIVTA